MDVKKPMEVEVKNEEPLSVKLDTASAPLHQPSMPPNTTRQEDLVVAGQRQTSLLWEGTQALIAGSITLSMIGLAVMEIESETITNAFFFIVATYFTRTNHTRIGGIGAKPTDEVYRGR